MQGWGCNVIASLNQCPKVPNSIMYMEDSSARHVNLTLHAKNRHGKLQYIQNTITPVQNKYRDIYQIWVTAYLLTQQKQANNHRTPSSPEAPIPCQSYRMLSNLNKKTLKQNYTSLSLQGNHQQNMAKKEGRVPLTQFSRVQASLNPKKNTIFS